MKKLKGLALAILATSFLLIVLVGCSASNLPQAYSVSGTETPVPAITSVVGERTFVGSSKKVMGNDLDSNFSVAYSYKEIENLADDIQKYCEELTKNQEFTLQTVLDPQNPSAGAVLTKPAVQEGKMMKMTIVVDADDAYTITLENLDQPVASSSVPASAPAE